jgi:hypothetical protein
MARYRLPRQAGARFRARKLSPAIPLSAAISSPICMRPRRSATGRSYRSGSARIRLRYSSM